MERLKEAILRHARNQPEGVPLTAKGLLHLGNRAAIDQALSRLARRGELLRAGRGLYVLPVRSRFGNRAPSLRKTVEGLAAQCGERIANSGAMAANEVDPFQWTVYVLGFMQLLDSASRSPWVSNSPVLGDDGAGYTILR